MDRQAFIGVVSDTHGYYDPALDELFEGAAHIVHAGDIGPGVLERLRRLAPVTAVVGNTDWPDIVPDLGKEAEAEVLGLRLLVGHIRDRLVRARDVAAEGVDVVVIGHSHRAKVEHERGVLFLNPGSAGHSRFGLPRTVALLTVEKGRPEARIVPLE